MGSEGLHSPHCHIPEETIRAQLHGTPILQLGGAPHARLEQQAGQAGAKGLAAEALERKGSPHPARNVPNISEDRDQEHGQARWWTGAHLSWGLGRACVAETVWNSFGASLPPSSFCSCILSFLGPHASWGIWAPDLLPHSLLLVTLGLDGERQDTVDSTQKPSTQLPLPYGSSV